MATSLANPEATFPQRMSQDSGFYPADTTPRFVRADDLYRNLVEANRDRYSGSAWSEEPRNTLIYIATPAMGQPSLSGIQNVQRMGFWIQNFGQGMAEIHTSDPPSFVLVPRQHSGGLDSPVTPLSNFLEELLAALLRESRPAALPPIVQEFAAGLDGVIPSPEVVAMAGRLVKAASANTVEPEFAVDVDGALSFDLRLNNGLLLLAELDLAGYFDASVYDDQTGKVVREQRLPHATEAQFLDLLR